MKPSFSFIRRINRLFKITAEVFPASGLNQKGEVNNSLSMSPSQDRPAGDKTSETDN
jgi:hypothetical protein